MYDHLQPEDHPSAFERHAFSLPGHSSTMSYNVQPTAAAAGLPPGAVLMPRPQPIPGVPPGLEYLTTIDQVLIQQQVELLEGRQLLLGLNK